MLRQNQKPKEICGASRRKSLLAFAGHCYAASPRTSGVLSRRRKLFFSEAWEQYLEIIPNAERYDMIADYYRRLIGDEQHLRSQTRKYPTQPDMWLVVLGQD